MENMALVISVLVLLLLVASYFFIFKGKKVESDNSMSIKDDKDDVKIAANKIIIPLKIQACERLLLYIERIQFPVLIKRVFIPGMSRDDFQFSLLQNVQDEFEHNLAQRLYVTETTWQLVALAKEEVMQNVNAVFNDNPNADVAQIAQKLASFENPMVDKAVVSIKREFDSL